MSRGKKRAQADEEKREICAQATTPGKIGVVVEARHCVANRFVVDLCCWNSQKL